MTLIPSELVKAVVKVGKSYEFPKFEGRLSSYGAIQAMIDNTNRLVPKSQLEASRTAGRRITEIPTLNKYDANLLTERACTQTPDTITSAMTPLSWDTVGFSIKEFPEEVYSGNYIDRVEHFEWQMRMGLKAAFASMDSAAVAYLEAEKSGTNASPLFGPLVADAKQIEYEQRSRFYKSIPSVMRRNDLPDTNILDVTTPEAEIAYLYTAAQGAGNGSNTAYQVAPVIPYESNRVINGSGVAETHYLAPQGSLGILTWNSIAERTNSRVHEGNYFTTMADPILGFTWGVKVDKQCTDVSATYEDVTAGIQTVYSFYLDYAFMRPYSSSADDTPIYKYEILEEVTTT